jgi:methylthioribose-1-phosphate isomerase
LYKTLFWTGDAHGKLSLIDQTRLPLHVENFVCDSVEDVWNAIKVLKVRGAPAIGVAAAYGLGDGIAAVSKFCRR